jgi:hypothetical protein
MSVVSYPQSFLHRPEDRSFLMELKAAGCDENAARLMLYRIWADYATGGSDRRPVDLSDLAQDRQVRVLESFCEWTGKSGDMVRLGIASGFLRTEPSAGGGDMLICTGFYPINSNWNAKGNSFQRRGAYTRILAANLKESLRSADEREELWSRSGGGAFKDIPAESRREALVFINRICRALKIPAPADSVLAAGGVFNLAVQAIQTHSVKSIDSTLMWLLSNRGAQSIPDRIDAILREWPVLARKAAEEMGDG